MLTFQKSAVDQFHRLYQGGKGAFINGFAMKGLRYGQAFHQWFKLEKITNEENKAFCDKLYYTDDETAKKDGERQHRLGKLNHGSIH